MKSQYVNTLQEGDRLNDYFVAARKDLRVKQDGGKFLGMVFKDKTGEIGGIMWNNAVDAAKLFEPGDVVVVRGTIGTYQNRLQVRVDQVLPLRPGEYNTDDLVAAPEGVKESLGQFVETLGRVENPHLRQLLDAFLKDEAFMAEFGNAAAAKKWHHEYAGGLARHCQEMARIALGLCEIFPEIDRDVLLSAIFFHDMGKTREMSHELFVDYTNEGKLLGHLQIGCEMLQRKIAEIPGFPDKLRLELLHCILSHHGELANGSPVTPKTLEAVVLHHIDNLDAQATAFIRIIRETRERGQEWSDYMPLIDRVVWTK
ncbi:MAG: HD domain-containing protein [Candidatus Hydrogenedens sp.]|nr:HD domain-containing protein [Candidatus Hydrogenedentota bacterium]NLF58041.1 HD domain-containing protein [Candidatus Hydrogenedens sp.]